MKKIFTKGSAVIVLIICLLFICITNVYAEELIDSVTITGLNKPTYNQKVYDNVASIKIPDNANYKISEIIWWYDDNQDGVFGPLDYSGAFVGVRNYFQYEIVLEEKEGYKFATTINSESGYEEYSGSVSTSNMSYDIVQYNNDGTLSIVGKPFRTWYEYINGEEQTVVINNDAEFEIDADYNLFENGGKVYVDDIQVDSSNYTSRSGSTIITLVKDYINSLSDGEHTLKVVFNDGYSATTSFSVIKNTADNETNTETNTNINTQTNTNSNAENEITPPHTGIDNPATGDNVIFYISMLILSVLGLFGTITFVRK